MNKEEELRQKWITGRTLIISEMLDNPDEDGIYPTTKCFTELDDLHNDLMQQYAQQEKKKAFPNTEADGIVFCGKCGKMI